MFWPLNATVASGFSRTKYRNKETTMKLAVLGGAAVICAATAIVAAQQAAPTEQQTQTVIGCVRGEGTAQSPWVLAGVVIPPPPAPGAGRGGFGGGGGRGGGRGAGAPGGGAPAGREGAGREGGGPPPAAAAPPAPPPPPIDLRITGLDLTPWKGYRAQVEGTMGAPGGAMRTFNATSARSVFNYGCDSK
jgi:hypothetical protein